MGSRPMLDRTFRPVIKSQNHPGCFLRGDGQMVPPERSLWAVEVPTGKFALMGQW
jgi:hypothetical protein